VVTLLKNYIIWLLAGFMTRGVKGLVLPKTKLLYQLQSFMGLEQHESEYNHIFIFLGELSLQCSIGFESNTSDSKLDW